MIVSQRYKFIFVHNPKVAGTSITDALSHFNDFDDIADSKHETINQFFQRCNVHSTSYYVFGFVRNPWDRLSSFYHYWKDTDPKLKKLRDINELAKCLGEPWTRGFYSLRPQYLFFNNDTHIGRFERLQSDFDEICDALVIGRQPLARINESKNEDYASQYSEEGAELVYNFYKQDVMRYGYDFRS